MEIIIMDFYISWSRSDPIFSNYFVNCKVLISPSNTLRSFNLGKWTNQPDKVIIDSSAFYYMFGRSAPPPKEIFKEQVRIIKGHKCLVTLCPFDYPISPGSGNTLNTFSAIEKTLGNAYEFLELYEKEELYNNPQIDSMGVIQGTDKSSIQFCVNELQRMGFKKFGLGSLAALYSPEEILRRVSFAADVAGVDRLHVFGISRLDVISQLKQLNIESIDSTRPTKAAIYNAIFYSNPFRTYGIKGSRNADKYSRILSIPLPCQCPTCKENPEMLLVTEGKKAINARAVHNYYHLVEHLL